MDLAKTWIFLFFLIMGTSGIQAEENEQRAQRGGLGWQVVTNVRSEEHRHEGLPNHNQIPGSGMEMNYGSVTYQNGKIFKDEPGTNNMFGAYTDQSNTVFIFRGDGKKTQTKGPNIRYGSTTVQINNRFLKRQVANQASLPSPNSQNEEKAQDNTESQAHSSKRNSSNKQFSLSFHILYVYFLIVLSPYNLF